jgi:tetratricopeptide (TPR) repeat protein
MARSELGRGRLGPAQALASRALEIARRTLGEQQVVTLRIRSILADVALARGDATGAFALAQSIAALPMPIDGEVARAAGLQAGEALLALGRIDEAKARLQTAAAAFDVPSIGGSPTTALRAQAAWALALARGGATDEAVAHAERLLPRVEAIDRGDWRGGALRMVLAEVLALRDPARAATLNEQGRTLWRAAWQGGDGAVGYTAHAPP